MNAYINSLSYCLGDLPYSVEESASAGRLLSSVEALKDSGFSKHRICSEKKSSYDLARECAMQFKEQLPTIGALVYATCLPLNGNIGARQKFDETKDVKYLMDYPASHLQSEFGMDNAMVFGINQQACTSMLGSLRMAKMLLADDSSIDSILCLSADRFPEGACYEQSYNLISDGAAAAIVSRKAEGYRIVSCHGITNGGLAQANDEEAAGTYFVYSHRVIIEALKKANLSLSQIAWIVPQNMNIKAWQILSRLLRIDDSKIYAPSRSEVGHVISGDNIINLDRLDKEHKAQSGDYILLIMAGYGMNWQCTILEKC